MTSPFLKSTLEVSFLRPVTMKNRLLSVKAAPWPSKRSSSVIKPLRVTVCFGSPMATPSVMPFSFFASAVNSGSTWIEAVCGLSPMAVAMFATTGSWKPKMQDWLPC